MALGSASVPASEVPGGSPSGFRQSSAIIGVVVWLALLSAAGPASAQGGDGGEAQGLAPGATVRVTRTDGTSLDARFVEIKPGAYFEVFGSDGQAFRIPIAEVRRLVVTGRREMITPAWSNERSAYSLYEIERTDGTTVVVAMVQWGMFRLERDGQALGDYRSNLQSFEVVGGGPTPAPSSAAPRPPVRPAPATSAVSEIDPGFDLTDRPAAAPDAPGPAIELVVVDRLAGTAISGARVTSLLDGHPIEARSDATGLAMLDGLPAGRQTLWVSAAGYDPATLDVDVGQTGASGDEGIVYADVALEPAGALKNGIARRVRVDVIVVDRESGRPVGGAEVELTFAGGVADAVTDPFGLAVFEDDLPPAVTLTVAATGYRVAVRSAATDGASASAAFSPVVIALDRAFDH